MKKGRKDVKKSWAKVGSHKTNKHGVVDGASNHKTLFDEMI
jgi:hypothetical protein